MHISKTDIPTRIEVPGATARQLTDFGDATGYGAIGGEFFSLGAGTDLAPLLEGLDGDSCHSPHWGYMVAGRLTVTYGDGSEETCEGGDVFYWPPGHSVRVAQDAEIVLFSPQLEHGQVMDHILDKVTQMA